MIKPVTVILAAVLLFGPLIVAEVGVRLLTTSGRLPEAPSSVEMTDVSLANLRRRGQPDVMVLGTSSIRNALKPDVLEGLIKETTGQAVTVQNVSQAALSLKAQRLLVHGLADRGLLADTVIVGLSPTSVTGSIADGAWFLGSELGRLYDRCAATSNGEALDCQLGQVSALWRWRGQSDRVLAAIWHGMPSTMDDQGRVLKADGWTAERPASAKRLQAELPKALQRLDVTIDTPEWVQADFVALVSEIRSQGSDVVAFTLPYAEPLEAALLERNPDWRDQLERGYDIFRDIGELDIAEVGAFGDWWQPASQNDLRHLSRKGAEPFTRQLWQLTRFREALLEALDAAD